MQGNEKSAGKRQKKSCFQGLQSEFRKIVWTDRNELIKQTIVVVCVSIVLCAVSYTHLTRAWKRLGYSNELAELRTQIICTGEESELEWPTF